MELDNIKIILEADATDFNEKAKKRAIDALRVAKQARTAAEKAKAGGKDNLADKLNKEADDLEQAAQNWNADSISTSADATGVGGANNKEDDQANKNNKANGDSEESGQETDQQEGTGKENAGKNGSGGGNASNSDTNQDTDSVETDKNTPDTSEASPENKQSGQTGASGSQSDSKGDGQASQSKSNQNKTDDTDESDDGNEQNGDSDQEQEDQEDSENNKKDNDQPVKDIFNMLSQSAQIQSQEQSGKEPRDPTIEEIKKMLSRLTGEAKRGAIDGLKDILNSRASSTKTENLQEAFNGKSLRELSDDEFADSINNVIDLINEVEKLDLVDSEEKKKRLAKIQQVANDPAIQKELQKEDNVEIAKDFQKIKARDKEKEKFNHYRSLEQFKINFYNAINDQVEMMKVHLRNYSEINPEYEDENIITKADIEKNVRDEVIPTINFYFDCSGSWTSHPDAVEIGKAAVATVKEFEDRGEVKLNIYYFGRNSLSSNMDDVWGGGTSCWSQIIQNIKATEAKNVVLMTDCDMSRSAKYGPVCKVDGSVWFIWSLYDYTTGSKEIVKHLIGRGSNNQYAFGSGGTIISD